MFSAMIKKNSAHNMKKWPPLLRWMLRAVVSLCTQEDQDVGAPREAATELNSRA